jgi:predicted GNAT superfamily acetyltransferase
MIVIRDCAGFDELEACVRMQVETWGVDPSDTTPRKTFLLAQKIGGQVIGAFDAEMGDKSPQGGPESLVGFVFSLPGVKTGCGEPRAYLHSHMLAVREGYRNQGLGRRLKLEQRREALARGIRYMEWTFDPLEIKNAFLNIHKLGAVVSRYHANFYGVSSSRLQGGLPTDRLLAEWHMDSPRVQATVDGGQKSPADTAGRAGIRGETRIEERIGVPASIYEWKATEAGRERALAVQLENRRKFQEAFSQGLAVVGFVRDSEGNGVFELGRLTQPELDLFPQGMQKTI